MMNIITFFIDILFPPSSEELLLRSLSPEEFTQKVKKAPYSTLSFVTSLFAYKDPLVSELVWQIKYRKNRHAVDIAAQALFNKLKEIDKEIFLIPIPISKKRRKERGYNQCELLVDAIIEFDKENILTKRYDILFRTKHLSRQTDKNRKERLESAQHIFKAEIIEELLEKEIMIADDVSTTGSTLIEARKTMLEAGYVNVKAITIAH